MIKEYERRLKSINREYNLKLNALNKKDKKNKEAVNKIKTKLDKNQKEIDDLLKQAKDLEATTEKLSKVEAAKVALQVFDLRKKAGDINKQMQLDATEANHINETYNDQKALELK